MKWLNQRFINKIKDKIVTFIAAFLSAIAVLYFYFQYHYEQKISIETERIELELNKNTNKLDSERSRIKIELDDTNTYFNFDNIFIDGSNLGENYVTIENSPFAVPNLEDDDWKWQNTNMANVLQNMNIDMPDVINQLNQLSKIQAFYKDEFYDVVIEGETIKVYPIIMFEFVNADIITNQLNNFVSQNNDSGLFDGIDLKNVDDEISTSLMGKNDFMFNSFFNIFSFLKESRLSDVLGPLNNSEYYFNNNVFLINGYYNIELIAQSSIKKLYLLRLGILKNDEVYLIQFIMPVGDSYNDLKMFKSLINGIKIIK